MSKKKVKKSRRQSSGRQTDAVHAEKNYLEEYGIEIQAIETDPQHLISTGYTKLPKETYTRMSAIFQYVPGLAADKATFAAADANTKMLEGAYKVVIKDGMHLANSKATEGAFRGALLSNAKNQVAGQAELFKINPVELSKAPQYALGVFSALSMVTGQYFMTEINNRLRSLESQVSDVQSFLEDDKRSRLFACEYVLNNIFNNLHAYKNNESARQAALVEVKTIKRESIGNMQFFSGRLVNTENRLSVKDKKDAIEETVLKIGDMLPQYWCSLSTYSKSCLSEVLLSDMDDPEYLENTEDDLLKFREQYHNDFIRCEDILKSILREAKALNWNGNIPLALIDVAAVFIPNSPVGIIVRAAGKTAVNVAEHKKAKDKEAIEKDINGFLDICGDLGPIDAIWGGVEKFRIIRNNPIEFIQTPDATYFRYHKDDE